MKKISKSFEKNYFTFENFRELSKAFEAICKRVLLKKLEVYHIRGINYDYFSSYLAKKTIHFTKR